MAEQSRGWWAGWRWAAALLLGWALLGAAACDDEEDPAPAACTPGMDGCACMEGACLTGLVCEDARCRPTCALGSAGCACDAGGCAASEEGLLVCAAGRCEVSSCTPGEPGCVCAAEGRCGGGASCQAVGGAERCVAGCTPGEVGCACDGGGRCGGSAACDPETARCEAGPGCTPGNQGCACDGGACVAGLTCEGGTCAEAACAPGLEGCACLDGACGYTAEGHALVCDGGVCTRASCPVGMTGCACNADGSCEVAGAQCDGGFCVSGECIPGAEGCRCLGGGCDPGLTCRQGAVCVDSRGTEGGACRINGTCDRNLRCDSTGVEDVCVYCDLGSIGCQCRDDASCLPGLTCAGGLCLGDEAVFARTPPQAPRCYTPCSANLTTPDGTRACAADGMMEGCLAGQSCVEGSCVGAGEEVPECADDAACPDFQLCIQGRCYAECASSAECATGMGCHRRVCRVPCSLDRATCGAGQVCEGLDGNQGFCVPRAATEEGPSAVPVNEQGTVGASETTLEFSNIKLERRFTLYNNTDDFVDFQVTKAEHVVLLRDGQVDRRQEDASCTGAACPLWWVELGEFGAISREGTRTVRAAPRCGESCPVVIVRVPEDAVDATRWRGALKVESPLGRAEVALGYVESPAGRWTGAMSYFATFESGGIDPEGAEPGWLLRADRGDVSGVRNGLIQRWGAFRSGGLTGGWDEFVAILRATESEQWRFPSVQQACLATNGACYLFDAGAGVGPRVYVTRLEDSPVPAGVTSFPMEMNLYVPDQSAPELLRGKVVSETALTFAGSPAVELELGANPADARSCDPRVRSNCVVFLDRLELEMALGGHYRPEGSACAAGETALPEPWLVPGFLGDATRDASTGTWSRGRCVRAALPFDLAAEPERAAQNVNLALGNPVPNGRSLRRTVELLDGAIIDQQTLFILFRERLPALMMDEAPTAYGYLLLRRVPGEVVDTDADGDGVPDGYAGSVLPAPETPAPDRLGVSCSPDLLREILGSGRALDQSNAPQVIAAILDGGAMDPTQALTPSVNGEEVHYLCVDTGLFDGGPGNTARWGTGVQAPNDDSCLTGENGLCEDGLSGSQPFRCTSGTDLADCGMRPGLQNNNTCATANNGRCEDSWSCALGTDLADCGMRSGVAANNNTCPSAGNGVCEDEEAGQTQAFQCAPGTDRADCGVRYQDDRVACPLGSEVDYFTTSRQLLPSIAGLPCQRDGSCAATLAQWRANGNPLLVQDDPAWTCADPTRALCDANRLDLRDGKTFYTGGSRVYDRSYAAATDEAFRYKTRFVSREGGGLAFAPSLCDGSAETIPYCYDAEAIEALQERVDCVLDIYQRFYATAAAGSLPRADQLYTFLEAHFSSTVEPSAQGGLPARRDGFERLNAELLIMLGDDAFTSSFESRFDLAGSRITAFEGDRFEDGGIRLSGIAGFEMFRLYQAAQYYSSVLERFYALSPVLSTSLASGAPQTGRNFISDALVTDYLAKVVRASTQRARVQGEIARRYQAFNRPDLARRVIERGYLSTYLESVVLSNILLSIYDAAGGSSRPQLLAELETAQRSYSVALLNLRELYGSITDNVNYFGYPADYLPFPALDVGPSALDRSAFETVLTSALSKLDVARQREQVALSTTRGFDSDAERFQSELTRITRTYESQLIELCGSFEAPDGRIYPAIRRYASLDDGVASLGDPCGLVGNGAIFQALGRLDLLRLGQLRLSTQIRGTVEQIEIERRRVADYCQLTLEQAQFNYSIGEQQLDISQDLSVVQANQERVQRITSAAADVAGTATCDNTVSCITAGVATGIKAAAYVTQEIILPFIEEEIRNKQRERGMLELDQARWNTTVQCDFAEIDANANTARLLLQLRELDISVLELEYQFQLALSEIQRLSQQSRRLEQEQEEALQLAINVEAALNDPNVRIYRNDAVINADVAFQDALREAYRLTLVYQYYTSQSYARLDELFLIRLVTAGEFNLENYLIELQNAFSSFEESFGTPDVRVAVLSLRDDIFGVPRLDANGRALTVDQRATQLRERLLDPARLDSSGYITLPFRTNLADLSPLTRNHKVLYIEANIEGNDNGDFLGRLYLRQTGTGVVRTLDDATDNYRLPARTAVLNPFFNSTREFAASPEVYRSYRLRDRPFVNTEWELILNQRDETVNRDINLRALTDIKLYVFYTDFTVY